MQATLDWRNEDHDKVRLGLGLSWESMKWGARCLP